MAEDAVPDPASSGPEVEHAHHGKVPLLGWPARMSASRVPIQAAPLLGEHTDEVIREDLGLGDDEIESLRQAGALDPV